MKALMRRYLNEIVGLTMMALLTIALIDGEAHAIGGKHVDAKGHKVIEVWLSVGD